MNKILPVYLFYGEEQFLLKEAIQKFIKEIGFSDQEKEMNYSVYDNKDIDENEIIRQCETYPFLSEKRLVLVKNYKGIIPITNKGKSQNKKDKAQIASSLLNYLQDPVPWTILIFSVEGKIDKRKKLFKEIEKCGKIFEFKSLSTKQCEKWIVNQVKIMGKKILLSNAQYLLERVGVSDLYRLDSEIKKIVAYIGDKEEIQVVDIDQLVAIKMENNIFVLTDTVGLGKTPEALKVLHDMLEQGEAPLKLLFMISRQLRLIFQCKSLQKQGHSSKEIASIIGQHPFVIGKCLKQANSYSFSQLSAGMELVLQADINLKSTGLDPQIVLENLIIQLGL